MNTKLEKNLRGILETNLEVDFGKLSAQKFIIVYDLNSVLSKMLFESYSAILPDAVKWNFYELNPDEVKGSLRQFEKGTLVILIQSSSFRISNFAWRLELFNLGFKVIEHGHLGSNADSQAANYVDSLEDQNEYFRATADYLVPLLEGAKEIVVETSGGCVMTYTGGMEKFIKKFGGFRGKANKGCAFPIGEVFSELLDLKCVNGEMSIYAYSTVEHRVEFVEPFKVSVKEGRIYAIDGSAILESFVTVMELLGSENQDGAVWMRELGLGMNRGLSKTKQLTDISAFERVCGMHVSLGLKHDIFRKKVGSEINQRYHVDIFPDVVRMSADGKVFFEEGKYVS